MICDNHLNTSSANTGEVLSWNGSDYDWVADQTGGGGSGNSLSDGDKRRYNSIKLWCYLVY